MAARAFAVGVGEMLVGRDAVEEQQKGYTCGEAYGRGPHACEAVGRAHVHGGDEERPHGGGHHDACGEAEHGFLQARRHGVTHKVDAGSAEGGARERKKQT